MKVTLSHFASSETGVEIRTVKWKKYTTDLFSQATLQVLVWQVEGDTIDELFIHRGTNRNQVLSWDLEQDIKEQILALLPKN